MRAISIAEACAEPSICHAGNRRDIPQPTMKALNHSHSSRWFLHPAVLAAVTVLLCPAPRLAGQTATPAKCHRCGTVTCEYVVCCEIIEKTKKEKKAVWSSETEYFCTVDPTLPGLLALVATSFGSPPIRTSCPAEINPNSDSHRAQIAACIRPSAPKVRRKLIQQEEELSGPVLLCQPKVLCAKCAGLSPQAESGVPAPKPPLPDHVAGATTDGKPSQRTAGLFPGRTPR